MTSAEELLEHWDEHLRKAADNGLCKMWQQMLEEWLAFRTEYDREKSGIDG